MNQLLEVSETKMIERFKESIAMLVQQFKKPSTFDEEWSTVLKKWLIVHGVEAINKKLPRAII